MNAHRIPESRHNRNGRLIRPLMQTLPYSLVKQKSSSSPNSVIHTYTKSHQTLLNQSLVNGNTGKEHILNMSSVSKHKYYSLKEKTSNHNQFCLFYFIEKDTSELHNATINANRELLPSSNIDDTPANYENSSDKKIKMCPLIPPGIKKQHIN